jgi:hypothetical protein
VLCAHHDRLRAVECAKIKGVEIGGGTRRQRRESSRGIDAADQSAKCRNEILPHWRDRALTHGDFVPRWSAIATAHA